MGSDHTLGLTGGAAGEDNQGPAFGREFRQRAAAIVQALGKLQQLDGQFVAQGLDLVQPVADGHQASHAGAAQAVFKLG